MNDALQPIFEQVTAAAYDALMRGDKEQARQLVGLAETIAMNNRTISEMDPSLLWRLQ